MNKIFFGLFLALLFSCENKTQETPIKDAAIEDLDVAEKKIAERIASGDTLAIPNTELQNFLPQFVAGYLINSKPTGKTFNENGMSWSVCQQSFIKGKDSLTVHLADYNGAYGLYAGASAVYASGESINNDQEKSEGISLKNGKIKGWESYQKNSGDVFLIAGIEDRFLLTIEANNQKDPELVKAVAENIDLEKLSDR